jgi:ABC-2 type transport system permease protein
MKILWTELKNVVKDSDILRILIIGPIIITLIIGCIYLNTYVDDMPVAVLDMDQSSLSKNITQLFDEDDRFAVTQYVDSEEKLKELLDNGTILMGLCIPKDFSKDISRLKQTNIVTMVNGENIIVANNCYAQAATIINTVSAGAQLKVLQAEGYSYEKAKSMVLAFNFEDRTLYDPKFAYMNYLLLAFVATVIQQVFLSAFGISIINNGSELVREKPIRHLLAKFAVCAGILTVTSSIAIAISNRVFGIAFNGSPLNVFVLGIIFLLALSCPAIIIAALAKERVKYVQICLMFSLPTIISCGYIWPQEQMPGWFAVLVKVLWPFINFARPFDELIFKGIPLSAASHNIIQLLIYFAVWFPIALLLLMKSYRKQARLEKNQGCNALGV